jgi:phosphoserine phosphatase RsbU/P
MSGSPIPSPDLPRLQQRIDDLQRAVEELTVLNEIAREIGSLVDLEEVLRRIVARSADAVSAEEGVISLVDDRDNASARTLIRSMMTGVQRGPYHINELVVGWVQQYRRPLRIDHMASDTTRRMIEADPAVRSLLSVPLLVRSRLIGVLTVCNREDGGAFTEADQRLLSIIAAQSAQVIDNARLHEEEKALLQLHEELKAAFHIQARLLPERAPSIDGYDLFGRSIPAKQVGGDFFDFVPDGDGETVLCVGDVSGKGLPAALLMASSQAIVRGQLGGERPLRDTVAQVNREFYRNVRRGNFLTLFMGVLSPREHRLTYVNAGHNRPMLLRSGGVDELARTGVAVGLLPGASYEEAQLTLEVGDLLFIFSDGVTEAMNERFEEFGEARLLEVLHASRDLPAGQIVEAVTRAVTAFTGEAPVSDDITMLVLVRRA